jgi:hypothetical protein
MGEARDKPASRVCTGCRGSTTARLAKEADVSPRTIEQAKRAHEAGLGAAVKDGKVSVKHAAEIAKLPEPQRKASIENPPQKPKKPSSLEAENEALKAELEEARENVPELRAMAVAAEAFKNDEQFKRITHLEAELVSVKRRRDELMRENTELKKEVAYWKKRAGKRVA